MSRLEDRSLRNRVGDLEERVKRLAPVHVRTTILVCGRYEPWATALSCAADLEQLLAGENGHPAPREPRPVRELDRREDLDLLIDPRSGLRKLRTEDNAEAFDELAASGQFDLVEIFITVHEGQLAALLSPARVVAVLGGNRAGKTRIGIYWLIRQWILRGGAGALFWILAPTDKKALKRIGRRKTSDASSDGDDTVSLATMLPERLRISPLPKTHRGQMAVELIDGSIIEGLNTYGDGDNLKSEKVAGILFDEAGASPNVGNWQQCASRTTQGNARVMLATTPKPGHWAYTEIVLQEPHSGGQIEVFNFSLGDNPWLTSAEIWSLLLADGTITATELDEKILPSSDPWTACADLVESPRALREHFGLWTADGLRLWAEWTDEIARTCTRAGQGLAPELLSTAEWGDLPNITPQVAHAFFHEVDPDELRQVWGEDFNINPQTCVRVQVHGRPEYPDTWTIFVLEEVQTQGTIERHAARMQAIAPGAAIACDPSGDIPRHDQAATEGDEAQRMRDLGFVCKSAVGRGQRLKSSKPTLLLLHKLMRLRRVVVHTRCKATIKALQMQQAKPDGRPDKRSGVTSPSDQLSSPTDALRYLVWALMKHELEAPAQWN